MLVADLATPAQIRLVVVVGGSRGGRWPFQGGRTATGPRSAPAGWRGIGWSWPGRGDACGVVVVDALGGLLRRLGAVDPAALAGGRVAASSLQVLAGGRGRASGVTQGRLLEGRVDRLPITGAGVRRSGRAPLPLPFSWPSASLPLTVVRGGLVTGGSDGARGLPVGSKLVPLMVSGVSGCKATALVVGADGSWAELVARTLTGLLSWPRGRHGGGPSTISVVVRPALSCRVVP